MELPTLPSLKRSRAPRVVVGLDIEPGAVRAVEARMDGGRLVATRTASAVLDPGVVRDGEIVEPERLADVLRSMFEDHDLDRRVRIGVANQRIVVRHLLVPPISDAKELDTAVRFMAGNELPMPLDQAVLDYVVLGSVETAEGRRTRVLVVAARRSMIDVLLASARSAGLRPEGIDLAAFAMVRALGAGAGGPVLHLAIGGVVNLAVARDGECVFTRVVGGGMEAMAAEIAERENITTEEARQALAAVRLEELDAGSASETSVAERVLTDGLRRIAGEVRNSLDFHLTADPLHGASSAVERVVLTGSAASVAGFAPMLAQRLSLPVEVGQVEGDAEGVFAVAAGLAVDTVPSGLAAEPVAA